MNRRSFISALLGTAGAMVLDPERLLWTPSKTIFIPKPIETGISLRMIRQYDCEIMRYVTRLDVMFPIQAAYNGNLSALIISQKVFWASPSGLLVSGGKEVLPCSDSDPLNS